MVTSSQQLAPDRRLSQQAREWFAKAMEPAIAALVPVIRHRLANLAQGSSGTPLADVQLAMDAAALFSKQYRRWAEGVFKAWRAALQGSSGVATSGSRSGALGLLDHEVVEQEILVSRLSLAIQDRAHWELNDLRLRIQRLESSRELSSGDIFRPEVMARLLLQSWADQGMTRQMWALVHDNVHADLSERMTKAYHEVNELLIREGGTAQIDLKSMVRRTESAGGGSSSGASSVRGSAERREPDRPATRSAQGPLSTRVAGDTLLANSGPGGISPSGYAREGQETRSMTSSTPLARARQRAWDVLGQVRRLLGERPNEGAHLESAGISDAAGPPSPPLARALLERRDLFAPTELMRPGDGLVATSVMPVSVEVAAQRLRQRTVELKAKAEKASEKATIEIVALMFQAILAEERIPATVRVWFARLQIPVLRLALAERDFFASVEHPARQLIDRMGACALGFDVGNIAGSQLEREIKRIVQVIEQYPETGRRVYQLVFEEFKKFLGRSLTRSGSALQAATLAQQVEQKDALSIQYTIELRKMLSSVPVREEVREFLFRIWAEVLAMAAVRQGPQHEQTQRYKQAAADLLWSVSAKASRGERSRVVQQLPALLQNLREGMNTLAMPASIQDGHIKVINDAVMQAFVSRTEGMSPDMLNELVRGLAGLEGVVTNDAEGDVMLDPGLIELMSGVDAAMLEVIASGGTNPGKSVLAWAEELDLGAWFVLERDAAMIQVQYVWRSQRGQLHLFTSGNGKSYLVQTRRLASYLQAGLLVPVEDEALTVRATRVALAQLDAEPKRLLE